MHVPPYLRALNPEQQAAALATDGPVLVLAGAGSGKTRTLVYRIAHLIRGRSVDPRRILAVTFTNKAALEMRERVSKVVGKEARGVVLSTFHSLGARILREHAEKVGLPKRFSIYPTGDQAATVKRIMTEEVHVTATAGDDRYDVKQVLFQISDWKNRLLTPQEAAAEVAAGPTKDDRRDDYAVLAADVYPRYQQALLAAGACDFDDLLLLPVNLLRDSMEAREGYWRRWQYLMVDEYQDTNGAQLEMARLLAGPQKNLCVVGDDDQSIYAWRGADVRNILDFEHHFPGAQVVILEENYRSTQRILDAANSVIAHNTARKEKTLRTGNVLGPKIDYWEFQPADVRSAEYCEAEMVAREIGLRRYAEGLKWSDFAVIYRTNLQGRPLEEAMREMRIPYRVVGGTSVFDRKEIADAVAYMRVIANPRDEVSLRRVLGYQKGVGRTTILRLVEESRASKRTLWSVLQMADRVDGVNRPQWDSIRPFVELMDGFRARWEAVETAIEDGNPGGENTLHEWARSFVKALRMEETIRRDNQGSERATEVRIDILRDFVASIGRYEERTWAAQPLPDEADDWGPPTLMGFLERVSLTDEDDRKEDEGEPDRVTLLTLHSAKGLEFSHVFMVGLEEEIIPHSRSVNAIADGTLPDPIAEERRLFYVGITRARHRLTLSGCAIRGGGKRKDPKDESKAPRSDFMAEKPRQPSRFLKEIPPDLLEVRSGRTTSSLSEDESKALKQNFSSSWREMLAGGGG